MISDAVTNKVTTLTKSKILLVKTISLVSFHFISSVTVDALLLFMGT